MGIQVKLTESSVLDISIKSFGASLGTVCEPNGEILLYMCTFFKIVNLPTGSVVTFAVAAVPFPAALPMSTST